jgi:hypothetical protein
LTKALCCGADAGAPPKQTKNDSHRVREDEGMNLKGVIGTIWIKRDPTESAP